jgi:TorA maturation chaperone TorD
MSLNHWLYKASLYELLAQSYLYTTEELARAITEGEYAEALSEIAALNDIVVPDDVIKEGLHPYQGRDTSEVYHELRREYTRLFIGRTNPLVYPFGGSWYALEKGQQPLLFVGKESMAVERFMRRCGVVQPEGTNEPLDHIASELEFLQYLCLLKAEAACPPEGVEILDTSYADFYSQHFRWFAGRFANSVVEECRAPFFVAAARVLLALPAEAL